MANLGCSLSACGVRQVRHCPYLHFPYGLIVVLLEHSDLGRAWLPHATRLRHVMRGAQQSDRPHAVCACMQEPAGPTRT